MRAIFIKSILLIFVAILVVDCAKRGTPTGGPKDETPPVLLKAVPDTSTVNFRSREIKLYFDELVKLNNIQKQLIVSPPMETAPSISPSSTAGKVFTITIKDTLQANTTYVLNFGQSITDNNESNPYPFFKYVFSTGDYIDSLTVNGDIRDAFNKEADDYVSVMLYKYDENYTDSLIYNEPPMYITNTLDSLTKFEITNVREGKYKLFALKDASNNNLFNQKTDKIAFYEGVITVPTDSSYTLNLFTEVTNYRAASPGLEAKNRIRFGFEGDTTDVEIKVLSETPEDFKYRVLPDKEKDTLHYWFTPFEADSLIFTVTKEAQIDTFNVRIKDLYWDSLAIQQNFKSVLPPNKIFKLSANTPLTNINTDSITIMRKDSVFIDFKAALLKETNEVVFTDFNPEEEKQYQIKLYPGSIKDMFGETNDTLTYAIKRNKYNTYGTIVVKLADVERYPIIVQLTDSNGKVKEEQFAETPKTTFYFNNIEPTKYLLRVIYDDNNNKQWDTGDYLKHVQPEQIYYYPDAIELRANWVYEQEFILKKK
ncbi:hypothetical protein NBRC110019_31160 [Neptunitalea chrysea]|uniref:SbsA Ig-like domain-containing protein n=1 Tax=Neptunitalea chrysea TaxID=1647581 RepID=A0A9W6B8Z0_9FLAO|nr:Ig-like domain-containing protein [Neptunitalea chrysea]GLB54075.1 hypothetical protein NBRC110019_31160 [Neptunitalea chrysea]